MYFIPAVLFQNHDVYLQGDLDSQQGVSMQGDGLQGEVQILHATPEQISQLQHAQHIQILQGDQVIQVPVPVSYKLKVIQCEFRANPVG